MRRVNLLIAAVTLWTAACTTGGGGTTAATPPPSITGAQSPPAATTPAVLTPTASPSTPGPIAGAAVAGEAAREALGRWLGPVGNAAEIEVDAVEPVTWPNGCLGLVRPSRACTQALVDGYRVTLALGSALYEVRTDVAAQVMLWAPQVEVMAQFAEASANYARFTTDDGGTVEVQPVPGTEFGVPLRSLATGDALGLGLAPAPQREGFLLVSVDPIRR